MTEEDVYTPEEVASIVEKEVDQEKKVLYSIGPHFGHWRDVKVYAQFEETPIHGSYRASYKGWLSEMLHTPTYLELAGVANRMLHEEDVRDHVFFEGVREGGELVMGS